MPRRRHPAESFESDFRACDGGYRSIVQRAPCLIVRYDSHLRVCYVNEAVVRSSGIPRDEWVGRTTDEAGIPGGRLGLGRDPGAERWISTLREAFETGREMRFDLDVEGLDGPRSYAVHVLPERGVDGSVTSVVTIGHDVTAHARAERDLLDRERRLLAALDASGTGVAVVDGEGAVTGWSPAQELLAGLAREEVLGRSIWDVQSSLLPAESRSSDNVGRVRASFAALLSGAATGYEGAAAPFMVERPDGTRRLVETTAIIQRGADDRGAMLIYRQVEPRPRTDRPGGEQGQV